MTSRRIQTVLGLLLLNAVLFLIYGLLGKLPSLLFSYVSPFWPPAALSVFAAMLWGWRAMPAVFLGSLWVNTDLFNWSLAGALWVSLGNVLAPMAGIWGLRSQTVEAQQIWNSPAAITRFLFWMGAVNGLLSGLFGALGLVGLEGQAPHLFLPTLLQWAVGDASAALMLVPVAHLLWLRSGRAVRWWRLLLQVEGLFALAFSVLVWAAAFFAPGLSLPVRLGLLGMLLLPPIWSVFRLDQRLTLLHLAVAFILVLGATIAGHGPYASLPLAQAVVGIELLGIAMSASILYAGALHNQRQQALAELRVLNRDLETRAEDRAQDLLRKERNFRDMIERLPAPTVITNPDTARVLYANPAARELFGNNQSDLAGMSTHAQWVDPDIRQSLLAEVKQAHAIQNREIAFRRLDGSVVWVLASVIETHFDKTNALLFAFKDISERMQREKLLQSQAQTDALTGVPNRRHFMTQAGQRLCDLAAQHKAAAFALFDLDDFKQVNDTRGHACGDLVLQQAARLLHDKMRPQDVFARLGGEEFCLLMSDVSAEQALELAETMRQELDGQMQICPDGHPIPLPSCSIGVAWAQVPVDTGAQANGDAPGAADVLSALMERADAALYQAKSEGKNRSVLSSDLSSPASRASAAQAKQVSRPEAHALMPLSLLRALAAEVHFGRFFERAAQAAAHLVGADGAAFIERDGGTLSYRFFHGLPEEYQQQFAAYRFPADQGTAGQAIREGRGIFHADYAASPGALPAFVDSGLKANYLIPVRAGGQTLAILAIAWFSHHPTDEPDPQQTENVQLLADLMAGALRRERLERKLRKRATRDSLTRLPNRASLEQHLARAVARARRQQQILAVGMLDLDDFKPVNDQWGHAAGDALLRSFSQRLQQVLRETDFVGRLGGDEFVLVLEGLTRQSDLEATLSRLHEVVQAPFDLPDGHSACIDMSLGLALYPQHGADADGLIRAADAALYASKAGKTNRSSWWQLCGQTQGPSVLASARAAVGVAPSPISPYGPDAQRLLRLFQPQVSAFASGFVQQFYDYLGAQPDMQVVLRSLSEHEQVHLHRVQETHLLALLSPDLEEAAHRCNAQRLGAVHALTGVSTTVLVDALEIYVQQAITLIQHSALREADRPLLQQTVTGRVRVELLSQAQGEQETIDQYMNWIQTATQTATGFVNRIDFMHWVLEELNRLPGIQAVAYGRPDAMGQSVVEFSTPRFEAYVAHFQRHRQAYLPLLESASPLSQASQLRAWRNERIATVASFSQDARAAPWRDGAEEVGFRSAASIPLRDGEDRMAAILTLYGAYPNQFESPWMQHNLTLIGQLLTRFQSHSQRAPLKVLPDHKRVEWRSRLTPEGLDMLVQPIIDLRTGTVKRVEALARLRLLDGTQVTPGEFLPWFGASEITRLFTLGLDQSLQHLRALDAQGLRLELSVNLPPEVLMQPDCPRWIAQALERADLPPARLHLELLESGDFQDAPGRDAAVQALSALGVRLEMDDLGSGYSSLLRLRQLPFHTVKIDQGLVREAGKDPRRVIGFIGSLIRLAHTLDLEVVVEGLESPGLVEAAAMLGADFGQGFALARPMSAESLVDWNQHFIQTLDPAYPATALGALAAHWLWEYGERDLYFADPALAHHHCALSHYLQSHGLTESEVGRVHAQMHQLAREKGIHSPEYRNAMSRMVTLLMKEHHEPQRP
ncbi:MAG: diguanylate cyclase [Thiomonas sp.]|nr:diguanylate cyclase [Thiomonas sp.]